MRGAFYIFVISVLINFIISNRLLAGTDIKMKTGEVFKNVDSLKIFNSNIDFYLENSGSQISLYKRQLQYISLGNGNMLRYKSFRLQSYPGNVNINVINFFNGSFVSGTVNSITPDSVYFTVLNDSIESVIPTGDISFISYSNSLIEEFVSTTVSNDNQKGSAESVFKKKYFGETGNETFVGVKAGYVSSWMNGDYVTAMSNKNGFMLGGVYYNKFSGKTAIDLSLMYVQKGENILVNEFSSGLSQEYQFNFNYIEFQSNYQLLVPFRKWNLYFDLGLYMAEMIYASGINKTATPDSVFKIDLGGGQSNLRRFDLGMSLGTGGSFKVKDHLISIGFRFSDGWIITGNTFNYNYYNLNYFRTQNYISVYAVYGFRIKNKVLN